MEFFKSSDPAKRALRAIVQAVIHYKDPVKLAEISEDLARLWTVWRSRKIGCVCKTAEYDWDTRHLRWG